MLFTTFMYDLPYLMDSPEQTLTSSSAPVLGVTGIASPDLFVSELERQGHDVTLMDYPDHHRFTSRDIIQISAKLESLGTDAVMVTTAKDAARLTDICPDAELRKRIYVLPVAVRFIGDSGKFMNVVTGHVDSFAKDKQQ